MSWQFVTSTKTIFTANMCFLAFMSLFLAISPQWQAVSAQTLSSTDILYVYTTASLGSNFTGTTACAEALTSNLTCYSNLGLAVTDITTWSTLSLADICQDSCTDSLTDYVAAINDVCGESTYYNISGTVQTASDAGEEMIWRQRTTCLTDEATGEYCNTYFQEAAANGTTGVSCSDCYLDYLSSLVNSEWGQDLISPGYFSAKVSSCSATGYSVTYTATSTSSSTTATSTAATNTRCNTTDPDTSTYTVESGDTCLSISAAQDVSTGLLASKNGLDPNCTYLTVGQELCLPEICEIHLVQVNETCDSIIANLTREITVQNLVSWNSELNAQCSNIASLVGKYICITYVHLQALGLISASFAKTKLNVNIARSIRQRCPIRFPSGQLPPQCKCLGLDIHFPGLVLTAICSAVPTNAVTTSNTDCGYWYTVQSGDECQDIASEFGIALDDFYFLNPQLNGTCGDLWAGNSYVSATLHNHDPSLHARLTQNTPVRRSRG